ncbi:PAS domain S-box-containing protein [Pedobacter sp. AK017]|uniref:PAS domain-containing protein n=1 Tax=Pedobacter sp. AK017 TaxID=2723073 RepID=UPI00161C966C|nr:PAS domain S-box protein [Pedobacter sp. AK017]MBB5436547.1 PAS domain S-box-containing protein [Pedobacter sp. AK017]
MINLPVNANPNDAESASFKRIFEENPAPMYIFDLHTHEFLAVNAAALDQYGYQKEEFLSMSALQIRSAQEVERFKKAILEVRAAYSDYGVWKHIRKNGEEFFVHIYAHCNIFQNRVARVVMAIDIDQKVKAENALKEKNEEIADILESITDGFYAMNENWEVTYINKEAERILNCKRTDLLGKNLWEFFPGSKEGRFYQEYKRALEEKISVHFEECYAPLGVWGSMHVYPKKDGLAIYFVDITEQKKNQIEQSRYMSMIEKQNEQLKKISWIQSHELRSPLSNILGLVELVNENSYNADVIEKLKKAAKSLDDVVRNITEHAQKTIN